MSRKHDFKVEFDFDETPEKPGQNKKKKKQKSSFSNMSVLIYLFTVIGISLILSVFVIVSANDVFAFVKEDKAIVVEIPEKATRSQIANILDKTGVINSAFLFRSFAASVAGDKELKSGKYELNSNMDYRSILSTLQRVSTYRETVNITIPEGFTLKQAAMLLDEKHVCTEEQFINAVKTSDFNFSFIKTLAKSENRLEGYLFPDTYQFYINDTPENVIKKFLGNFDKKVSQDMRTLAKDKGRTLHETITIASLIEREARKPEERERIAGIIYNRLKAQSRYPFLQIDATVMYAVGQKEKLTEEDLKVQSPYNTYINKGLPPGPIANPGLSCILAALNPEENDYYFYVAKPDGSHIFSKTLDEHNKAVREAQKLFGTR